MRVPFWPRKNARLERRLTAVVEKSEEVRKSIKAPPSRVVIDTTFVDQFAPAEPDEANLADEGDAIGYADLLGGEENRQLVEVQHPDPALHCAASDELPPGPSRARRISSKAASPENEPADREAEANAEEWAALQEAEDYREYTLRLEEETAREENLRKAAEAKLAEAARLEAEAQEALEALRRLAEERQQAEENERLARERALAAQREAAVQRKRAEELEAELERQLAGREAIETEAEAAEKRLAALQADIASANDDVGAVEDVKRREAEVTERKTAAEAELSAQTQRVSELESEIKREREERLRVELRRDAALARIREAERRATQLRQSKSEIEDAMRLQDEAREAIAARKAQAASKRAMAELLAAQILQDRTALSNVLAETEQMQCRAQQAEQEVADLEAEEQALVAELSRLELANSSEGALDLDSVVVEDIDHDMGRGETPQSPDAVISALDAVPFASAAVPDREDAADLSAPDAFGSERDKDPAVPVGRSDDATSAHDPARERLKQAIARQQARPTTSRHGVVRTEPQAAAKQRTRDIDLAAAASVGSPVPLRVKSLALPEAPQSADKGHATSPPKDMGVEGTKANRRDKRVSEQKPATLWQERMSEPLNCVIRDKSASGAMLEIMPNKFGGKTHSIAAGDKYTLTIQVARERSFVTCEVMRVEGRRCGVRFCGPFRTEILQKARTKPAKGRSIRLG